MPDIRDDERDAPAAATEAGDASVQPDRAAPSEAAVQPEAETKPVDACLKSLPSPLVAANTLPST